jgi:hypothetical protein
VLVDYVWKEAEFPENEPFFVDKINKDLISWISAVQAYEAKAPKRID